MEAEATGEEKGIGGEEEVEVEGVVAVAEIVIAGRFVDIVAASQWTKLRRWNHYYLIIIISSIYRRYQKQVSKMRVNEGMDVWMDKE